MNVGFKGCNSRASSNGGALLRGNTKSGLTFGVAVALHAAAVVALRLVTPGHTAPAPASAPVEDTIAIETEGAVASPVPAREEDDPSPTATPQPGTRIAARESLHRDRTPTPSEANPSAEQAGVARAEGTGAAGAGGATAPLFVRPELGLGKNAFLARGALPEPPAAVTTERPPSSAQASMWKTARDRDTELGLGPEGPVLRALTESTRVTATPTRGRAVFIAIADGEGIVKSVELVAYSGDGGGWTEAAKQALEALKGKRLRLPSTAKGAELLVEITSDRRMPSGHHAGIETSLFGIPLKRGDGPQATRVDILPLLPKLVQVPITADGKDTIPLPSINFTILGIAGDPADIGAKVQRVVHSRLLGSRVL